MRRSATTIGEHSTTVAVRRLTPPLMVYFLGVWLDSTRLTVSAHGWLSLIMLHSLVTYAVAARQLRRTIAMLIIVDADVQQANLVLKTSMSPRVATLFQVVMAAFMLLSANMPLTDTTCGYFWSIFMFSFAWTSVFVYTGDVVKFVNEVKNRC